MDPIPGLAATVTIKTHDPERDLVSRFIHEQRVWEPFETRLWVACHAPDDVVVDVGANLGYFSILSALAVGALGRVFAFEPEPLNYSLLEANLADLEANGLVEGFRIALGAHESSGKLWLSDDNLGDHQLFSADSARESVPVAVYPGVDVLSERVDRIDLLKLDTQGTELAVLEGLWPMLLKSRPRLRILIELTPYSLRQAGASGAALIERLATLGLPLAIVDHVQHRLVPSSATALCEWCDNVDRDPQDQGFMNLFVGAAPRGFQG
ncbi:MAG: FkbM family methyltransferase [Pseudomonadota bacterium]